MYLDNYIKPSTKTDTLLLDASYNYFLDMLFEKACRLFKWHNLPNNIPQKEIETRLLYNGYCGLINDDNVGYMVANGGMSGVTQYSDEFTHFTYAAPKAKGGTVRIGKKCTIIDNTSLRNPLYPMIARYALLMAHSEVTLKCALVNMRKVDAFVSDDDATVENIKEWEKQRYEGKIGVILDKGIITPTEMTSITNLLNSSRLSGDYLKSTVEVRNEILRMFYNELGVNYTKEKRGNMTEDEVNQNNNMLLLNVDDMLASRKRSCDLFNALTGSDISVEFSDELKKLKEESADAIEDND